MSAILASAELPQNPEECSGALIVWYLFRLLFLVKWVNSAVSFQEAGEVVPLQFEDVDLS